MMMDQILEILKYVLPSVVTFLTAWYIVRGFLVSEQKKRLLELKMKNAEASLPLKLQAYERILLLMERITIPNLLVRASIPGQNAEELHRFLAGTVREEFDHNLSQQLYVTAEAWGLVRSAKEETLKLLHTNFSNLAEGNSGKEYLESVMESYVKLKHPLCERAIVFLKKEVTMLF